MICYRRSSKRSSQVPRLIYFHSFYRNLTLLSRMFTITPHLPLPLRQLLTVFNKVDNDDDTESSTSDLTPMVTLES